MNAIEKIPTIDNPLVDRTPKHLQKHTVNSISNGSGTVTNTIQYIQNNIYYSTGGDRQSVQFSEGFKFLIVSGFLALLGYVIWLGFVRGSEL